jgi:cysteinyl-tRNA synthetase
MGSNALLELDRAIWKGKQDLENEEFISQAREVLRDLIVLFGMELETSPKDRAECLAPVMGELLSLRQRFRDNKQWEEADAIRESLERGDVIIEDTEEGPRWRLRS